MSSLRNSLHRRNHKERSQLAHRARLGILEKHKDYVLRARDYHSKQERLIRLRQKAAERNKDEFYYAMNRQRTQGGVHVQDRGNSALPVDIVKVLKTQDENYLRTMRTAGLKKIDKLKSQLTALVDLLRPGPLDSYDDDDVQDLDDAEIEVLLEAGLLPAAPSKQANKSYAKRRVRHIIFAENADEARQYASSSGTQTSLNDNMDLDVAEERDVDLGWKAPETGKKGGIKRSTAVSAAEARASDSSTEERREAAIQHRSRLLKELSARLFRDKQLRYAERELEMQRLLMGKGGAKKLRGAEKVEGDDGDDDDEDESGRDTRKKVDEKVWKPRVYKWRVERKK
ncbi:uncharacterized protein FIBRA_00111 [Fibroporia radiculosa]|uniref:U3 small nucleolar RNA-associated protein 11 n=1 Tax=Fibroporia radiculosa TaxID=599839 RepID=J7RG85_9APHY|nr:uncharacterized protein FIBRA_00111 [Fibroporia radiculosa]CCL98117.1 predicted protein [Fibroporia radiculosa]